MSSLIRILAVVLVLFVLCAPSCDDRQDKAIDEEKKLAASRDSIKEKFEDENLTGDALSAFGYTAMQKLSDFADYLHLVTDSTLLITFRQKAADMIRNIFINKEAHLRLTVKKNGNELLYNPDELLHSALSNKLELSSFRFDSILIKKPLQRIDAEKYTGELSFCQVFSLNPSTYTTLNNSGQKTVTFYLVRTEKSFGVEKMKVWTVFLGDMN